MDDVDAKRAAMLDTVDELTELIRASLDEVVSDTREVLRHLAGASLLRGTAFLDSATALARSGRSEGVGLLVRASWESWLVGAFLLFGGTEALGRLQYEAQRQQFNLTKGNGLTDLAAVVETRLGALATGLAALRTEPGREGDSDDEEEKLNANAPSRLTIETMAREVGPLIEAATGESADVLGQYNILYRSHSAFDAHGIEGVMRYVTESDTGEFAYQPPESWIEITMTVRIAAMYLSLLSQWVLEDLEIDRGPLESLQTRIFASLQEAERTTRAATAGTEVEQYLPPGLRL